MAGQQIAKRIPSIKFPNRRAVKAGAYPPAAASSPAAESAPNSSAASPASSGSAGAASIQPKRPKVSKEEIDAVLFGGVV